MRRAPTRVAAAAMVVAALGAVPGAAHAYGPALQTAISENAPSGSDGPLAFARTHAAGAGFVRIGLEWNSVVTDSASRPPGFDAANPKDPAYYWRGFDRQIQLAAAARLQPIVVVDAAPLWAEGAGGGSDGIFSPDPVEFGLFMHAAAMHYSGKTPGVPPVRYWAAWNEPNLSYFLAPQFVNGQLVSVDRYRELVNAAAAAVHSVDPTDKLIAGELFPFTSYGHGFDATGALTFTRMLFCLSAGAHPQRTCNATVHADIWSDHPYTVGGPMHHALNPGKDVSLGDLPALHTLVQLAQRGGELQSAGPVPLWITEFAWDTNPPNPKGVPVALHAEWTAEAIFQAWRSGVSLFTWFSLRDKPLNSSPSQSGLYYRCDRSLACDRPKPTLAAFRFPFVAFRHSYGVLVWGRTPGGAPGTVRIERSHGRGWRPLALLHTDADGIFTAHIGVHISGSMRALVVHGHGGASPAFPLKLPPDLPYSPLGS